MKSEKLGEHEVKIGKIKSAFWAIIKDIKINCAEKKKPAPIATAEFISGAWKQLQDKPRSEITAGDVSDVVMKIVGQTANLDGKSVDLFKNYYAGIKKIA